MISDFIFDGKALKDFGYMILFEESEDILDVSAMQFENIKAALSDISYRVAHSYEQNYTTTFLIVKDMCGISDDDLWLKNDDISELTRWLCRKQYKWFRFVDDKEDNDEIWYKVQIQTKLEFVGDHVLGLQLVVTANAPFGFTREINITNESANDGYQTDFQFNIYTDEEGYIYPNIIITCPSSGDLVITNNNENRTTTINNCQSGEIITIAGEDLKQITSSIDHDFSKDFNYIFPRFRILYGDTSNNFHAEVGGSAPEMQFSYRGIRKVGLK